MKKIIAFFGTLLIIAGLRHGNATIAKKETTPAPRLNLADTTIPKTKTVSKPGNTNIKITKSAGQQAIKLTDSASIKNGRSNNSIYLKKTKQTPQVKL